MKRARWAFTAMSWAFGLTGGTLSYEHGWLGILGVALLWAGGLTISAAWGLDWPKALSDRWPHLYPPEP